MSDDDAIGGYRIESERSNVRRVLVWAAGIGVVGALGFLLFDGGMRAGGEMVPAAAGNPLTSCPVRKEGNPLVNDARNLADGEVGALRGNVNAVTAEKGRTRIELISPDGSQTQSYELTEQKGLVYDDVRRGPTTLARLRRGETVVVSFTCYGNRFRITQVGITGGGS